MQAIRQGQTCLMHEAQGKGKPWLSRKLSVQQRAGIAHGTMTASQSK
jgi:hypothetical protein